MTMKFFALIALLPVLAAHAEDRSIAAPEKLPAKIQTGSERNAQPTRPTLLAARDMPLFSGEPRERNSISKRADFSLINGPAIPLMVRDH